MRRRQVKSGEAEATRRASAAAAAAAAAQQSAEDQQDMDLRELLQSLEDDFDRSRTKEAAEKLGFGSSHAADLIEIAREEFQCEQGDEEGGAAESEEDIRQRDEAANQHICLRLHALQLLTHIGLQESHLLDLLPLMGDEQEEFIQSATVVLFANQGKTALKLLKEGLLDDDLEIQTRLRCASCIRVMGLDHDALWKDCRDALLSLLERKTGDRRLNGVILGEIMELHGMKAVEDYTEEECEAPNVPPHVPDEKTRKIVRQCFKNDLIDPSISGGYIDFEESAFIPSDPDDDVVKSLRANAWVRPQDVDAPPGDGDHGPRNEEESQALHNERLRVIREHWIDLQQRRRAKRIPGMLTKAVLLFALYFILTFINSYYGPAAEMHKIIEEATKAKL